MTKVKTIFLLIILFVVTNFIIYATLEVNKQSRIESSLDSHVERLEIQYNTLLYHWKVTAAAAYKSTTRIDKVVDILSKASTSSIEEKAILRKQLFNIMQNKYKALKTKAVYQYGFVLANQEVFLRMHRPEKFGDNLEGKNYRTNYVSKFKKPIHGYEKGNITPAFRNTFPVFDKNGKYIALLEISFLSANMQDYFAEISKINMHFLIHKDIFNLKVWDQKDFNSKYIQSIEHPKYMMSIIGKHYKKDDIINNKVILNSIQKEIHQKMNQNKKFSTYSLYDNKITVITCYPIRNIQDKKTVAWLISYDNDNFIDMTIKNNTIIQFIIFFILSILFYFIYKNTTNKFALEIEVKNKTKDLQKVSNDLKDLNENLEQKIVIEVEKNKKNQKQLFKSEKMASMGEMIGNIAHQWRQPLSVISTASTGMKMQKEFGSLSDEQFNKNCDMINDHAQYLSKTIDDFRNFIKGDREKTLFSLKDDIESFLHLIEGSSKRHNINIILDLQENIQIDGYENELIQCLINIFNNAKDVLKEKNNQDNRFIFISAIQENNRVTIKIKDNAGGIPEAIINKVFEPYFTTKHKSQGTGLGLHMTYNLIVDGMGGTIEVDNVSYEYDGIEYAGAEFTIIL